MPLGTSFGDLQLPAQVNVKISGKEQEQAVNVTWQESSIDLNMPGVYTLTGELALEEGIVNGTVAAEIQVIVEDIIVKVSEIPGISTVAGTPFSRFRQRQVFEFCSKCCLYAFRIFHFQDFNAFFYCYSNGCFYLIGRYNCQSQRNTGNQYGGRNSF